MADEGAGKRPVRKTGKPLWNLVGIASNIGMKRKVDEDSVVAAEIATAYRGEVRKRVLLIVADGVGGASKGDVASSRAAFAVMRRLVGLMAEDRWIPPEEFALAIKAAIVRANEAVLSYSASHAGREGMGTTLALALVDGEQAHVAWLGDSRVYLVRPREVVQLTRDHSLVQEMVNRGELTPEQARSHPQRNVITRAVGFHAAVEPEVRSVALTEDDLLVVCCDGLPVHVADGEIGAIVRKHTDPQRACDELVALANSRGGTDNISVVVAPSTVTWW